MSRYEITFEQLRKANVARCEKFGHGGIDGWNEAEWGNAIAGECGELCNLLKKKIRHMPTDPKGTALDNMIADEIADVIIYLDLLAAKLDINLANSILIKFNLTSKKHSLSDRLIAGDINE